MLSQVRIQRYKSLYDVTVDLEPLTVFIGPNGSGKSNICESLFAASCLLNAQEHVKQFPNLNLTLLRSVWAHKFQNSQVSDRFWRGQTEMMQFDFYKNSAGHILHNQLLIPSKIDLSTFNRLNDDLGTVAIYDFEPSTISKNTAVAPVTTMGTDGEGLVNILTDIVLMDRERFNELELRFTTLVPNISRISIKRLPKNQFTFELIDKYSGYKIPAPEVSDGTLRILAFLTALYQENTPNIICFEEPENGIHPWLLNKLVDLLNLVTIEGIVGQPVQVLVTTHSPDFLNYLKPEQIRAVELDDEGKTQVHTLPVDSAGFQASMNAYDGELGELWFSNIFGGNPK